MIRVTLSHIATRVIILIGYNKDTIVIYLLQIFLKISFIVDLD